jgi:periplasmic protein TonB
MTARLLSPLNFSIMLHLLLVGVFVSLSLIKETPKPFEVPIEIEAPESPQDLKEIKKDTKIVLKSVNEPVPTKTATREVFGASRNSLTDDSKESSGIEAKLGNTLSKASDSEVLKDSDADSLPSPVEEYLVSEMPSVLSEVRPQYPKEAREKQIEGSVVMDVLIDALGKVREVKIIEGLVVFRSGAVEAMKKFRFKPAVIDGKPVAVRIRYSLKFELEF